MARIIVAEDNALILMSYKQMLEFLGIEYVLCKNGALAVEEFKKKPADLLILDVEMPVMNGLEACRQIRRLPEGIAVPIVIVSSLDSEEDIIKGLDAGANDYLLKPVKEAHLIAKLKTFLKSVSIHKNDIDMVKNHLLFAGKYSIEKILGYGAHSIVFMANDSTTGQKVAIKLLKEDFASEEITKPFFEIAGKLKEIDSPYVLKIFDYGQFNNRLYLVIDYADGGDLAHLLKIRKLNELEAIKLGLDVSKALKELVKHGLLHLDIKPENIMIKNNNYVLGDFGLVTTRETATIPLNMEIWTTAAYLPPEYLTAETDLSHKSDIYSLGVTIYQAVTGDNPFYADKPAVSMYRQVNLTPTPVKNCRPELSEYFSDTIAAMLSKNVAQRPDADELEHVFGHIQEYLIAHKADEARVVYSEEEKKIPVNTVSAEDKKLLNPEKIKSELDELVTAKRKYAETLTQTSAEAEKRLSRRKEVSKLNFGQFLKLAALLAVILIATTLFGNTIFSFVFGKTEEAPELGALSHVICLKCGAKDCMLVTDIYETKCNKCGGQMAFQFECGDCGKLFPFIPPKPEPGENIMNFMARWKKAGTCPECGVYSQTVPVTSEIKTQESNKGE